MSETPNEEWDEATKGMADSLVAYRKRVYDLEGREAVLVEALKELVRLKEIKGNLGPARLTPAEYEAAKGKAWQVARSLIAGVVEAEPDGRTDG